MRVRDKITRPRVVVATGVAMLVAVSSVLVAQDDSTSGDLADVAVETTTSETTIDTPSTSVVVDDPSPAASDPTPSGGSVGESPTASGEPDVLEANLDSVAAAAAPAGDDRRGSQAHLVMDFSDNAAGTLPPGISLPWAPGDVSVVDTDWATDGKALRFEASPGADPVVAVFDALPAVDEAEVLIRLRSVGDVELTDGAGVAARVNGATGTEDAVVVDLQDDVAVGTITDGSVALEPVDADAGGYARVRWRDGLVLVRTWSGTLAAEPVDWTVQVDSIDDGALEPGRIGITQLGDAPAIEVDWIEVTVLGLIDELPRAAEPPSLSIVDVSAEADRTSAVMRWTTNIPATSVVVYGRSSDLDRQRATADLQTLHEVTLPDLKCGTEYKYRVDSVAVVASDDLSASSPVSTLVTAPCDQTKSSRLVLAPPPAGASAIPGVSTAGLTAPSDRWIKPVTSAIWWNGEAERWDGVLPRGSASHWLVTDITGASPTFVTLLDSRSQSRPDVIWNEATNDLYVHFTSPTIPTMQHLSYAGGAYSTVTGPVTVPGVTIQSGTDGQNNHPSAMYQTPNGHLWVAVLKGGNLNLQRSTDKGATWLPAAVVVDPGISSDGGVIGMADFTNGGTTSLMLFASENKSGAWRPYRIDQNAANISAGNWTNESASLPAWIGSERSDDHLSVRSFENRVYVGFKTEGANDANEPLLGLLVREPNGTWSRYTSFFRDNGARETRPGLAIDESNDEIYLFYGMINLPRNGSFKKVPLSSLASIETATETVVFPSGDHSDGVVTSHAPVSTASNLAVVGNIRSANPIERAVLKVESTGTAPVISNINVAPAATTATVTWQTDIVATSTVSFGLSPAYGAVAASNTSVTSHQIVLADLACNTTYHYEVRSAASPSGVVATAPNATFTTAACVVPQPPVISGLTVVPAVATADVTWTTNVATQSVIDFGLTTTYDQQVVNGDFNVSHALNLAPLLCGTTYHYQVTSTSSSLLATVTPDATFTTSACPAPPVISAVSVAPGQQSALVTWTTDLASSSTVNYGSAPSYGVTVDDPALVTAHSVQLIGLTCASTLHFQVASTTGDGGTSSSIDATFSTSACSPNAQPQAFPIPQTSTAGSVNPADRWVRAGASAQWFNAAAGRWDAILPNANDLGTHWLATGANLALPTWQFQLSTRLESRPDVAWDEGAGRLYALFTDSVNSAGTTLVIVDYDALTDTYTFNSAVVVPGMQHSGASGAETDHPAMLHQTPNGDLWVAVERQRTLRVNRSTDGGATWLATPIDLASVAVNGGVVGLGDFSFGGSTYLSVFFSESNGGYLAWSIDQDAADVAALNWTDETAALPVPVGTEGSDDHLAVMSYGDHVFAAVQTAGSSVGDPLLALYDRAPDGVWTRQTVIAGPEPGASPTRPSLAVDASNGMLYYFYGHANGTSQYRKVPLNNLALLAVAPTYPLFNGSDGSFSSGVITPAAAFTAQSGLLALSENRTTDTVWHTLLNVLPPVPSAPSIPSGLAVGAVSSSELGVSWGDVAGETSYELEVSSTGVGGSYSPVAGSPLAANTVSRAVMGLTAATQYCVRVQASNTGGPSGFSTPVCATTLSMAPNAPVANFSADVVSVSVGDTVSFTDVSTNSPTGWAWTFTGGTPASSSNQNPTVTYDTPGTFGVSLTATNAGGSDVETKSGFVTVAPVGCAPGEWSVEWFDGMALAGPVAGSQCVSLIDMNFGPFGPAAAPLAGADTFSGRFTKTVTLAAGTYAFTTTSDDGVRVFVDGVAVIDKWVTQAPTTWTGQVTLGAGDHIIVVEYYENGGGAVIQADYRTAP